MKAQAEIVKMSTSYELVIPLDVEKKIRYLLRKYPTTEWSGVLFYNHEGNFEDNNLVLRCVDIYPMDLGTSTFTSFNMNEDVAHYMAENIELFDCDLGIIHSHHTMSSNFSGTDIETLKEEGSERNCVLSLIVNNSGTYSAAITRMVKTDYNITVQKLGTSYELFGEGTVSSKVDQTSTVKCVTKKVVQYFMLNIEKDNYINPYDYLDARFKEILDSRKRDIEISINNPSKDAPNKEKSEEHSYYKPFYGDSDYYYTDSKKTGSKQLTLFDSAEDAAVIIVTCCILNNADIVNLDYYIKNNMRKEYKLAFESPESNMFIEWKEFIIGTVLTYYADSDIEVFATNVYNVLNKYKNNPYIREYCNELKEYC